MNTCEALSAFTAFAPKITPAQQDHQPQYQADDAANETHGRPNPVIEIQRSDKQADARQQVNVRQQLVERFGQPDAHTAVI